MSTFLHKIKFFQKRSHATRAAQLFNPPREWLIGLLLTASTFSVGAMYLGYDFWEQYHMVENQPIADESVVRYHQADAEHYIDAFRKREALFQTLRADVRTAKSVPSTASTEVSEAVVTGSEMKPTSPGTLQME